MTRSRAGTLTHDYKRPGTNTLFAAMNMLDDFVISLCQQQLRHDEWLTSLRRSQRHTPRHLELHLSVDSYNTLKYPKVQAPRSRASPCTSLAQAFHRRT